MKLMAILNFSSQYDSDRIRFYRLGRYKELMRRFLLLILMIPFSLMAANSPSVSQLFEQLKQNPQALRIFLLDMPKGGELHYHWDGATYPENMAFDVRHSQFCYKATLLGVDINKFCPKKDRLNDIQDNPTLYQTLINNWSLTTNYTNRVETNQHFFQFFLGTEPIVAKYSGEMLADEMQRAANQHEDYMEMVYILDLPQMILLGHDLKNSSNFAIMNAELQHKDISSIVNSISKSTTQYYQQAHQALHCGKIDAKTGCKVKVRFLFSAMRNFPPATVFAQLAIAFKVAATNPLVLGIDLVGPENDYNSSRDYTLQMKMVRYFHKLYPKVHIRLHAGELSLEEAPPNFMRNHIAEAINIAGAERIGHGVDIGYETNALATLHEMAKKHICIEQLLTSNEKLLNIEGKEHPLPLYLHYHVPVVLSTDDEGILRTTLTNEFYKAVTRYNLSYPQIKTMARNVPTYSFLPGKSLWQNPDKFIAVPVCQGQPLGALHPSSACAAFLQHSEKAQMQWQLERELSEFEKTVVARFRG
jgi:adenosine deaminase